VFSYFQGGLCFFEAGEAGLKLMVYCLRIFSTSFAFLRGPMTHIKALISRERLPFTAAYVLSILATLYAALLVFFPSSFPLLFIRSHVALSVSSGKELHPYHSVHGHPDYVPLVVHLELRARGRHGHDAADANRRLHLPESAANLNKAHDPHYLLS